MTGDFKVDIILTFLLAILWLMIWLAHLTCLKQADYGLDCIRFKTRQWQIMRNIAVVLNWPIVLVVSLIVTSWSAMKQSWNYILED